MVSKLLTCVAFSLVLPLLLCLVAGVLLPLTPNDIIPFIIDSFIASALVSPFIMIIMLVSLLAISKI